VFLCNPRHGLRAATDRKQIVERRAPSLAKRRSARNDLERSMAHAPVAQRDGALPSEGCDLYPFEVRL
jgi:hypothetical protein